MRGLTLFAIPTLTACLLVCGACGHMQPPNDASNPPEESNPSQGSSSSGSGTSPSSGADPADDMSPPPSKASAASSADTPPSSGATAAPSQAAVAAPADNGPHLPPGFGGSSYDREAAEVVLRRAARQVKANCGAATGDEGSAVGPWGKTSVAVKMGRNGHSKGATIGAPYDGKPSGRCASQAFVNLQYPPFAGSDTVVDWEVEIVKPGASK